MSSHEVKKRFLVLHTLSSIIGIVGWVVIGLSVIFGAYAAIKGGVALEGIGTDMTPGERRALGALGSSWAVVGAVGGAIVGLLVVALGQAGTLGLAIEENTRASRELLASGGTGSNL
jgi:hypothetical protein